MRRRTLGGRLAQRRQPDRIACLQPVVHRPAPPVHAQLAAADEPVQVAAGDVAVQAGEEVVQPLAGVVGVEPERAHRPLPPVRLGRGGSEFCRRAAHVAILRESSAILARTERLPLPGGHPEPGEVPAARVGSMCPRAGCRNPASRESIVPTGRTHQPRLPASLRIRQRGTMRNFPGRMQTGHPQGRPFEPLRFLNPMPAYPAVDAHRPCPRRMRARSPVPERRV